MISFLLLFGLLLLLLSLLAFFNFPFQFLHEPLLLVLVIFQGLLKGVDLVANLIFIVKKSVLFHFWAILIGIRLFVFIIALCCLFIDISI